MGPSTGTNKQFSLKFSLSVCFSYESKKKNDIDYKRLKELNSTVFGNLPYILPSNPHPNPIRTSFSRFLKQKMSVRGSNPHLSFNSPLPTGQTDWIILDVTNALTVIRCISNALDGSEDDILWEDDGEDKDDSDRVTEKVSVISDDGESDEQ